MQHLENPKKLRFKMPLTDFVAACGFNRSSDKEFNLGLRYLRQIKALEVKQDEQLSKIVIVKSVSAVEIFFNLRKPVKKSNHKRRLTRLQRLNFFDTTEQWDDAEKKPKRRKKRQVAIYAYTCKLKTVRCTSRKRLTRAGVVCTFEGSCNNKITIAEFLANL